MIPLALASASLAAWIALCFARAWYWRIERDPISTSPVEWPSIAVVIPARNEEAHLPETLRSLWNQDYPGDVGVIVVDDHSTDRTSHVARRTAHRMGRERVLLIIAAEPLPPGWAGKVWAMNEGLARGIVPETPPDYVLFSDADIHHGAGTLRELVNRAEAGPCDLVSLMVRLRCDTSAERLMIPAFVFFFRLLYPFRVVNDPQKRLAGAAGGTMLVRWEALERIGGLASIRSALIDDCALAAAIKRGGHRIWLGLSETSTSTRSYGGLREIVGMIARSAYTQLGYSPLRLIGCVAGLSLIFFVPPAFALLANGPEAAIGGLAWLLMALCYLPMLQFYHRSPLWAPFLPVTAALYLCATVLSAWQHLRGQGGAWKGREMGGLVQESEGR